jgi:hypothetical protein
LATPRKRYFKVADQLLAEPWTREQKLTLVLLMAHLNTRWARDGIPDERAGECVLSHGAATDITGKSQQKSQLKLLGSLTELVSISVEVRDGKIWIKWPKFAEFQYTDTRSRGSSRAPGRAPSAAAAADATSSATRFPPKRAEPRPPALRPVTEILAEARRPTETQRLAQTKEFDAIRQQLGLKARPRANEAS